MTDALDGCVYEETWTDEVGYIWVCVIHGNNSKHDVDGDSHLPCLTIDPYNAFDMFHSRAAEVVTKANPIEAGHFHKSFKPKKDTPLNLIPDERGDLDG